MTSRTEEINARLKVICPYNDNDQFEGILKRVREELKVKYFGPNHVEAIMTISHGISSVNNEIRNMFTVVCAEGLHLEGPDVSRLQSIAEVDHRMNILLTHFAAQLQAKEQKLMIRRHELVAERDRLQNDLTEKMSRMTDELFDRMGCVSPGDLQDHKLGKAEFRAEIAALKEERRRFLSE